MGTNIRINRQYYSFIKYAGVEDVKELEKKIDDVRLRGKCIAVNLSIHDRKEPPKQRTNHDNAKI